MTYDKSNFIIHNDEFEQAYIETLTQNVNVWNSISGGALQLSTESIRGELQKKALFKELSTTTVIKHRDPNSTATIVPETLEMIQEINVKLNQYSFIAKTADAFSKMLLDPEATFSQLVGSATASASMVFAVDSLLAGLAGGIGSIPSMVEDATGKALDFKTINKGRFKLGDQYNNIKVLVVHSDSARVLTDLSIDEKLVNVGGVTVNTGKFSTLGIPVIVTDSESLKDGANFLMFALTANAGVWIDAENARAYTDHKLDSENTQILLKRESSSVLRIKGISYIGTTMSPTTADLKDKANWKQYVTDVKNTAGVMFKVKASA